MANERTIRRVTAAVTLTALFAAGTASVAGAHRDVAKWWQYDKNTWSHSWRAHPKLVREYRSWRARHAYASATQRDDELASIRRQHWAMHFHPAISSQYGEATWYDGGGRYGACGKPLSGMYAASRTLPCGALVSVRTGGRYVLVRILDRGPYGSTSRIIDLSPGAFSWLAPLGAGVIWVHAVRLQP